MREKANHDVLEGFVSTMPKTDIKVQGEPEFAYFQRMLFGASKLVTEYIESVLLALVHSLPKSPALVTKSSLLSWSYQKEMLPLCHHIAAAQYLEQILGCSVDLIQDHANIRLFFRRGSTRIRVGDTAGVGAGPVPARWPVRANARGDPSGMIALPGVRAGTGSAPTLYATNQVLLLTRI